MSWHDDYWLETLEIAMDEVGVLDAIDPEKRKKIAASLAMSAENMDAGAPSRGNPFQRELDEAKRALAAERARHEKRESGVLEQLARIHNVRDGWVYIDRGTGELMVYEPR